MLARRWLGVFVVLVGCGGEDAGPTDVVVEDAAETSVGETGGSDSAIVDSVIVDSSVVDSSVLVDAGDATVGEASSDAVIVGDTQAPGSDSDSGSGPDGASTDGTTSDVGGFDGGVESGIDASSPDTADAAVAVDAFDAASLQDTAPCIGTPIAGEIHISPTGHDTIGNGSAACPYQTINWAISKASGATTILIRSGTAAAPARYGAGCTAAATGGKCDKLPLYVAYNRPPIVFKGMSDDPAATIITGSDPLPDQAIIYGHAPGLGVENLTLEPKVMAEGGFGTNGIFLEAGKVTTGSEAAIQNVVIRGMRSGTASTGTGIYVSGGTSPRLGPGLTISESNMGIFVGTTNMYPTGSSIVVTSTAARPTFIRGMQKQCIFLASGHNAYPQADIVIGGDDGSDAARLHVRDCGDAAIQIARGIAGTKNYVKNVLVDTTSPTSPLYYGLRITGSAAVDVGPGVTIKGVNASAVSAAVQIDTVETQVNLVGVVVTENTGSGIVVGTSSRVSLDGVTVTKNGTVNFHHGLRCDGAGLSDPAAPQIRVRNSSFLENRGNGVLIRGTGTGACEADFGAADGSNVVFNTSARRNGLTGLCYTSAKPATVTSSTWSCGLAAATACQTAASTTQPVSASSCGSNLDYAGGGGLTLSGAQTCCGFLP